MQLEIMYEWNCLALNLSWLPVSAFNHRNTHASRYLRIPLSIIPTMVGPVTASLSPLTRADGSASYTCPTTGFNFLGSVNAPVELPGRRDALKPEEATVEASVKPGTYPAGVGERYVEGILKGVLGKLVLGREKGFPRRGVALTLCVVGGESIGRGDSVSVITRYRFSG